ncbi:hypothetical protein [Pseudoalteromonas sp. SG45-2]|uniref:hypothetical protein n=1 Tax=Pseudoalteromonas sp. SG45-2 TaxID=2760956 RepID=UPI0016006C92|nr:hypothetical protein [Pseudoalteromonas sp. SG45-2]MBB1347221.1 hypothetical protein [Pseudoalteromonas sp. SG45-2]
MERHEVLSYIREKSSKDIYYEYLIGQRVWYFDNFSSDVDYDDFKKYISRKLDIPFNNISIVGSAKTKFSFSPLKNFKEFNDESDFDLIIVSQKDFTSLWSAYREVSQETYLHGFNGKSANIFNGFISVKDDDQTYGNIVLQSWQRKILDFKAELQLKFNISHEVNYRIYADWESVQDYHIKGIVKLKDSAIETN